MLVIESGGTKSTWVFQDHSQKSNKIESVGLHPQELSEYKREIIEELIVKNKLEGTETFFFGSGCESDVAKRKIINFLEEFSLPVNFVESDLFGACLGHLGNEAGVVGIIGTGAIAAQFDGRKIIKKTSGLGYMLGDEGSGFDLGKRLLRLYFEGRLPNEMATEIEAVFHHQPILHRVYAPDGRKLVAGLSVLVKKWHGEEIIANIIQEAFNDFCCYALDPLKINTPINFVGSIAFYFQKELKEALEKNGYLLGKVTQSAVEDIYCFLSTKNWD